MDKNLLRTLEVDRLYSLGDYRNIRFRDSLEVPEEVKVDSKVLDLIRYMQTLSVEKSYRQYMLLQDRINKSFPGVVSSEELVSYIEGLQTETLDKIKKLIQNGDVKDVN
jgi:soluble cytochrome b562